TGYVVDDTDVYSAGMLIRASGFSAPANNGVKVVTGVDAGNSEVLVAGLSVEAAPPAGAKISLIGFTGAAGDINVDVSGPLPKLTSTALDFTTLGIEPGESIYIGGDGEIGRASC